MVEEQSEDINFMFYQLVLSLQTAAMHHLGKVASPITGKIERNLEAARGSIDMLDMIERKTANNLTPGEQSLLSHALYQLRLNFLDEAAKPDAAASTPEEPTNPADGETVH
ncbi:MAG: DUF1844 domain-containing protein [Candidatus Zixiibacteriota bacterium]